MSSAPRNRPKISYTKHFVNSNKSKVTYGNKTIAFIFHTPDGYVAQSPVRANPFMVDTSIDNLIRRMEDEHYTRAGKYE